MRRTFENWLPALALRFVARRLDRIFSPAARIAYDRHLNVHVRSGPSMRVRVRDLDGPLRVFGLGEYDFNVIDWTRVHTVIDAGAHVGSFSLWAAQKTLCRIHAFEPDPDVFAVLTSNIRRAGLSSRVVTRRLAVAGSAGTAVLHRSRGGSDAGSIVVDSGGGDVDVQTLTLADAVADSGFESIDVLKVDIEGAEYEVFKNVSVRLLMNVGAVFVECHGTPEVSPLGILDKFQKAGFRVATDLDASGLLLAWRDMNDDPGGAPS
jgi:FkbM family methyltransferase